MNRTRYIWKGLPAVLVIASVALFPVGCANQKGSAKSEHPSKAEHAKQAEQPPASEHPE